MGDSKKKTNPITGLVGKVTGRRRKPLKGPAKAVSDLLETLSETAFELDRKDLETIQQEFGAWRDHIVEGEKPPSMMVDVAAMITGEPDWSGTVAFVRQHRKDEQRFVTTGFEDLRDFLRRVAQQICQTVAAERAEDTEVAGQIKTLEETINTDSVEAMKSQVLDVVEGLTQMLKQREERHQSLLSELGSQLKYMRDEVERARKKMALDSLTQLFNRAAFDEQLTKITELNMISGEPACLMMMDIDHFKSINDTHGHPAGDAVLRQVSDILTNTFPRKNDFVARYGGEEFAIILQQDALEVAERLAERLRKRIDDETFRHDGREIPVTVSVGVAEFVPGGDQWLARADSALYDAKRDGRNRVVVATNATCATP